MSLGSEYALWALLVIASVTDLIWGKVYNWLTFAFLGLGLLFHLLDDGASGAGESALGVLTAFILFFPLWRLGAMAAGDVKLLMAVGAWTTPGLVLRIATGGVVIGALVGLFVMVRQSGLKESLKSVREHIDARVAPVTSHRMPFAPAFLCALFIVKVGEIYQWSWL